MKKDMSTFSSKLEQLRISEVRYQREKCMNKMTLRWGWRN